MKNSILSAIICALAIPCVNAAITGNGYYRVQNYATGRYIYVIDNKGKLNMATTSADVHAITLWSCLDRAIYDPASVIYVDHVSGSDYNFSAQGTSVEKIIGMPAKVREVSGKYLIYGTKDGMTKYLGDGEKGDLDKGYMTDNARNDERYWYFEPMQTQGTNYFGVMPEFQCGNNFYATMYASWPFSTASQGMEALVVTKIDSQHAIAVVESAGSAVAAGVPVLFKLTGAQPTANRLNIGGTGSTPKTNLLNGTYFDFYNAAGPTQVKYDSKTMRVLGTDAGGKPTFVTSTTLSTMPANHCWLTVPAGSPAEFKIMTLHEYEAYIASLPVPVTGITLDKGSATLMLGQTLSLTATLTPGNATDKSVTWQSSSPCASVNAQGVVTAAAIGTATITATASSGVKATCQITVTPVPVSGITLSQASASMMLGTTLKLSATVTPANATDKTVTWKSSSASATVDANGTVTAAAIGKATITATAGGKSATCEITVTPIPVETVTIDHSTKEMKPGETLRLSATITPANATYSDITWSSSSSCASVSSSGLVTALTVGKATITASAGGKTATCHVTITPIEVTSITLDKSSITLIEGDKASLTASISPSNATDQTVTWASTATSVATVSPDGQITAIAPGTATITASSGSAKASCQVKVEKRVIPATGITLDKSSVEMIEGESKTLIATVTPANATDKQVTWKSSDLLTASVDDDGHVKALKPGEAVITATCGAFEATCVVKVSKLIIPVTSVTIDLEEKEITEGDSFQLSATFAPANATVSGISWSSSNPAVAVVNEDGLVKGLSAGQCDITAMAGDCQASCLVKVNARIIPIESISLDKTAMEVEVGDSFTLNATITPADATFQTLSWTSSDPLVATVDSTGQVKALSEGETAITAAAGQRSATCKVKVNKKVIAITSISLDPGSLVVKPGETHEITAEVEPEDYTQTIRWTSGDTSVCTVDQQGMVTAIAQGKTSVTLSVVENDAISASVQVFVIPEVGIFETEIPGTIIAINGCEITFVSDHGYLEIYTPSGRKVGVIRESGTFAVPSSGIYILRTPGKTMKVKI